MGQHGLTWVLLAPDGPNVGPMNFAIKGVTSVATTLANVCHSNSTEYSGCTESSDVSLYTTQMQTQVRMQYQ